MNRGFTLTEMLIALALTAVAITIISEGVRHTLNFQQQLKSVREERETQSVTMEAIRNRLEHLVPATRAAETNGEEEILFDGQAHRLTFLAADPGYPSAAGVYEYTLELIGGDDDSDASSEEAAALPQLILSRRLLTDLTEFAQPSREDGGSWVLALSHPLSFGYAAAAGSSSSEWQDTATYPALITLEEDGVEHAALTVLLPRARQEETPEQAGQETTQ